MSGIIGVLDNVALGSNVTGIGKIVNVVTVQTRTVTTFVTGGTLAGVNVSLLDLPAFTPQKVGNKVYLEWHFHGELHQDTNWYCTRNGTAMLPSVPVDTDADGTADSGVSMQGAGIMITPYDPEAGSTPVSCIIRVFDDSTLGVSTTYKLYCRGLVSQTLYFNRQLNSATLETALCTGMAMEINV